MGVFGACRVCRRSDSTSLASSIGCLVLLTIIGTFSIDWIINGAGYKAANNKYQDNPALTREDAGRVVHGVLSALMLKDDLQAAEQHRQHTHTQQRNTKHENATDTHDTQVTHSSDIIEFESLVASHASSHRLHNEPRFHGSEIQHPILDQAALVLLGNFRSFGSRVMIESFRRLGASLRQQGLEPVIFAVISPCTSIRCPDGLKRQVSTEQIKAALDAIGLPYHLRITPCDRVCSTYAGMLQTPLARSVLNCSWSDPIVSGSDLEWKYMQTIGYLAGYDFVLSHENNHRMRFRYHLRVRTDVILGGSLSMHQMASYSYLENDQFAFLPRQHSPYYFMGAYMMFVRVNLCHLQGNKLCSFFDIVDPVLRDPQDARDIGYAQPATVLSYYRVPFFGRNLDLASNYPDIPTYRGQVQDISFITAISRVTHTQDACVQQTSSIDVFGITVPKCVCTRT